MIVKSLKASPSVLVFLIFCAFFGWQLSKGQVDGPPPPPEGVPEEAKASPPPPPTEAPPDVSSPAPPKSPRIAVVTFVTDEKSYLHLSLKNKDHYARRHGYDLVVDYEAHTERATTYWKFNMMERLIKTQKWDWIWWLDFDTLITNTGTKLTEIIDETLNNVTDPNEIDYLVTHDCNGLNTGSFLVRGHDRSITFLHDIYKIHEESKGKGDQISEQDAMAKLIKTDKASGDRTVQVPQWKLNAFPDEIACYDETQQPWSYGTFVVHFAGAWAHIKNEEDATGFLMRKYKTGIIWGDWKEFYE